MNVKSPYYQALFTSAIDGIILIDSKGIIQEVNQSALKLFQYEEAELKGKNISLLMPNPHREKHDQYISDYNRTHKAKIIGIGRNVEGLKKDGTLFPFRLAVTEVQGQESPLFAGVIHDLTKEVEATNKLKEYTHKLEETVKLRTKELENSQRLYMEIAKNFPNGTVSVLDKELNILYTEGKEWKKRNIDPQSILRDYFPKIILLNTVDAKEKFMDVFNGENIGLRYSIGSAHYELLATPIKDIENQIHEILVVEINTTEQKEAELEISNALAKEKALHEMKSRFVSIASHEFRTPLSTILSSATLLGKYKTYEPEKTDKHIQRIKSNVQNMNQILEDFLSIDKINEGRVDIVKSDFDLLALILQVVEEMESLLDKEQNIKLHHELNSTVPVHLDKQLFRNILINVLSNAIKYSKKDIEIHLNLTPKLQIQIIDYGIGIPQKEQEQLFQRFFRAENAINIQGTGLGLHIVKRYMDLLQGEISISSEHNKGTKVILTFDTF